MRKLSEIVLEMIAPFTKGDEGRIEKLGPLAVTIWNLPALPKEKQRALLSLLEVVVSPEERHVIKAFKRFRRRFSDDRRIIVGIMLEHGDLTVNYVFPEDIDESHEAQAVLVGPEVPDSPTQIPAKQILSAWSDGESWFGSNYNINLYKGCSHGCIYCDSRSECYQIEEFDRVRVKENALQLLGMELRGKRKKGIVANGAMSDPYNPLEAELQLARGSLELLDKHHFGASLLTKSDLVVRDIDVLLKIQEHSPVVVKFTVTTFNEELCKKIEPHVAGTARRLAALKEISQAGIMTGVMIWPILPFINDTPENILSIVRSAAENGAKFVAPFFGVTLRQNQRDYFYERLDEVFPGMKKKYVRAFNEQYECLSPRARELWERLGKECRRLGLLYEMDEIRMAIQAQKKNQQISLF